jgi:hypothetical protein
MANDKKPDDDKNQSKSFKKLEDILNIDSSSSFDNDEVERELKMIEERQKQIASFKEEFAKIKNSTTLDEYMDSVLKQMVEKGMTILTALQLEIEASPRGRDVETAASMISAVTNIISNMNSIKAVNAKIGFEREKIDMKKQSLLAAGNMGAKDANGDMLMVGSTNDLFELLQKKNIIGQKKPDEITTITVKDDKEDKE